MSGTPNTNQHRVRFPLLRLVPRTPLARATLRVVSGMTAQTKGASR